MVTGFLLALHCFSYRFSALCLLSALMNVFLLVNYIELRFYLPINADLKHPKLQFEMKQKTHYKLQSAKSMKQNIHKCHKDQPKTCKTLSPRIYKSKILFLREREENGPWSLTYSAKLLQSEHKASPVKPRFSHSLVLSCSCDDAPTKYSTTKLVAIHAPPISLSLSLQVFLSPQVVVRLSEPSFLSEPRRLV